MKNTSVILRYLKTRSTCLALLRLGTKAIVRELFLILREGYAFAWSILARLRAKSLPGS